MRSGALCQGHGVWAGLRYHAVPSLPLLQIQNMPWAASLGHMWMVDLHVTGRTHSALDQDDCREGQPVQAGAEVLALCRPVQAGAGRCRPVQAGAGRC